MLLAVLVLLAQVAVTGSAPPTEYASPVAFDVPIDSLATGSAFSTTELRKYVCEDSSIEMLAIYKARSGKWCTLKFSATIRTRPGHDKLATLTFAIRAGERTADLQVRAGDSYPANLEWRTPARVVIDAEEGKVRAGQASARVNCADLDEVLKGEAPTLTVKMTVREN